MPDPYYGGEEGFDRVFRLVEEACQGLLNHLSETVYVSLKRELI